MIVNDSDTTNNSRGPGGVNTDKYSELNKSLEDEDYQQDEPLVEITERSQSLFSEVAPLEDEVAVPEWKKKTQTYLYGNFHNALTASINVFSLVQFAMIEFLIQTNYNQTVFRIWIGVAITTNALFLLELIVHVVVFGTNWIFT